jgi:hypothetical protein
VQPKAVYGLGEYQNSVDVTVETSCSCIPVKGSPFLQELPASLERKRDPDSCSGCISDVISARKLLRKSPLARVLRVSQACMHCVDVDLLECVRRPSSPLGRFARVSVAWDLLLCT